MNGVRIDPVTPAEFLRTVDSFLSCGRSHVAHFCSAHPTTEARGDRAYRDLLNRGDLNLPHAFKRICYLLGSHDQIFANYHLNTQDGGIATDKPFNLAVFCQ